MIVSLFWLHFMFTAVVQMFWLIVLVSFRRLVCVHVHIPLLMQYPYDDDFLWDTGNEVCMIIT